MLFEKVIEMYKKDLIRKLKFASESLYITIDYTLADEIRMLSSSSFGKRTTDDIVADVAARATTLETQRCTAFRVDEGSGPRNPKERKLRSQHRVPLRVDEGSGPRNPTLRVDAREISFCPRWLRGVNTRINQTGSEQRHEYEYTIRILDIPTLDDLVDARWEYKMIKLSGALKYINHTFPPTRQSQQSFKGLERINDEFKSHVYAPPGVSHIFPSGGPMYHRAQNDFVIRNSTSKSLI